MAQYKGVQRQQLGAILRMIGIENGYYDPSNWQQAMRIDWVVDTWGDVVTKVGAIFLGSKKPADFEAMCTGIFRKFMTQCEKQMCDLNSRFIAGDRVTIADACMVCFLRTNVVNEKGCA